MKKIILFFMITFIISSCGIENKKISENDINKSQQLVKNDPINKLEKLINNQNFDEAIPKLKEIYEKDSNDMGNILNYMSALLAKGSITRQEKEYSKKAIEVGNKAIEKHSNNSELYRYIGYAYEIAEDYVNAFKNYDKSIELDKNNALAYSNRGHAYKLFGDYIKAEKDLKKAYELDKTTDHILINLAGIYVLKGENDKAIEYFNKVIETTKNIRFKSEAAYSVGNLLIDKKEYSKAEEKFKLATKVDPKFELGYLGLSKVKFLDALSKLNSLDNQNKLKLFGSALDNGNVAIKLNPDRALNYTYRGLMLKDMKGFEIESLLTLRTALDTIDNDITLTKIEKIEMKKQVSKEIKNLEEYIKNNNK